MCEVLHLTPYTLTGLIASVLRTNTHAKKKITKTANPHTLNPNRAHCLRPTHKHTRKHTHKGTQEGTRSIENTFCRERSPNTRANTHTRELKKEHVL